MTDYTQQDWSELDAGNSYVNGSKIHTDANHSHLSIRNFSQFGTIRSWSWQPSDRELVGFGL